MLKTKNFNGSVESPSPEKELNAFLKEVDADNIIDVKYSTNAVTIRKNDGTTGVVIITNVLVLFDEEAPE